MLHIFQEEGVEQKNVCLRHAYFKCLTLGKCATETTREEEKILTSIMNEIFILAPLTMKKLGMGTIWIRYSP